MYYYVCKWEMKNDSKSKAKIYNIWYKRKLIYIRAFSKKQIENYFREKENLEIDNIYECDRKWLWPDFNKLNRDIKFDLTREFKKKVRNVSDSMSEETNISFRIDKHTKDQLQKLADKERRSLANYLRTILTKLVQKGGKLD